MGDRIASVRWIYLSPHPDDAALCAGGLIHDQAQAGARVEIWTLMSGVPGAEALSDFASEMHARWSTTTSRETVEVRRREDLEAGRLLGATVVHFDFEDSIYRRAPDGAALYADPVGAPLRAEDATLPAQIARTLITRLDGEDVLVCPLGVGDHVDHVLVRRAAEMLDRPLLYVADIPYVLKHPASVEVKTPGMVSTVFRVTTAGAEAWIGAVASYRSQLRAVFEKLDVSKAIRDYWISVGGIRVWTPRRPSTPAPLPRA